MTVYADDVLFSLYLLMLARVLADDDGCEGADHIQRPCSCM